MAIILNDGFKINAGKPIDSKYLSSGNTTYTSISNVNSTLPISERYQGLTVNINDVEYWYKTGVTDSSLVEKIFNTIIPIGDYITGGTNLGYFSGKTGIQILPIDHIADNTFDGNYNSLYNYYYRDVNGYIRIGIPSDSIVKRGYVKSTGNVKSWLWNEYTGAFDKLGWILIDGDISQLQDTFQLSSVPLYYNGTSTYPYTGTSWTSGSYYNNFSNVVINTVLGSLTSGNTLTNGGRPFANKLGNYLQHRTVVSKTPRFIDVTDNSTFIYLSGVTSILGALNVGATGVAVYSGQSDTTLLFKKLIGGGDTIISQSGDTVLIYSSGNTFSVSWYTLTGKPQWLSGTTLQAFETGHTHSQYALSNTLTGLTQSFDSHTGDTSIHYKQSGITITESQVTNLTTDLGNKTDIGLYVKIIVTGSTLLATTGNSYVILVDHIAPVTISLPATPNDGKVFKIKDASTTGALINNITIDRNGIDIDRQASDAVIDTKGGAVELMYDSTLGWFTLSFIG